MFQFKSLAAFLLLASTCAFISATAYAQKSGTDTRDEAAIHDYVLTMSRVQAYAAAYQDYETNGSKDTSIADECKGKLDDDKMALVDKVKLVESSCPRLNAWIKQHGLTAQEFMFIPMTLITAGFAQVAVDAGGKPPAFINPANLQFVKEHKAELEKLHIVGDKSDDSSDN